MVVADGFDVVHGNPRFPGVLAWLRKTRKDKRLFA
jgi:hypothetical protein